MSNEATTNSTPTAPLPKIVISDVQAMLVAGKDREAIRLHYGLKKIDLKKLFMNPNLKGKKVHRDRILERFEIVDDVTATNTASPTPAVEIAPEQPIQPASDSSALTEAPASTEEDTY